jgi:hypothetical protein
MISRGSAGVRFHRIGARVTPQAIDIACRRPGCNTAIRSESSRARCIPRC